MEDLLKSLINNHHTQYNSYDWTENAFKREKKKLDL